MTILTCMLPDEEEVLVEGLKSRLRKYLIDPEDIRVELNIRVTLKEYALYILERADTGTDIDRA